MASGSASALGQCSLLGFGPPARHCSITHIHHLALLLCLSTPSVHRVGLVVHLHKEGRLHYFRESTSPSPSFRTAPL